MSPESTAHQQDPLIGRTVCGCRVRRLIAQGGMGNLYEARQVSLDRTVALKVLAPALTSNEQFLRRFQREARALANLIHTNVVAVHDFGAEGEIYGIVMEHVPGESVADMLTRMDIVPVQTAVDIVRQVADGLAFAHRHQIIHCDMKPENILVTPDGVAKVVDFGLAKSLGGDAMRVTQDGTILGTPRYMSPEQCAGGHLDHRTDVYSLGATFYRMVAGRDVFEADNPFAIMLKHKSQEPPNPRDINPDIPVPVANIILRMLEKSPDERFQAAEDVSIALRQQTTQFLEKQEPPHPRRDLFFVRDLLKAELASTDDVRQSLALQTELRKVGVEEPLSAVMVKRGLADKEKVAELQDQRRAEEAEQQAESFRQLALERGLVSEPDLESCVQGHRRRMAAGKGVSFTTTVVELGVLDRSDVVDLLRQQARQAQEHEDREFRELVRAERLLSDTELRQCTEEQSRRQNEGRLQLLRQVAVDLGLLSSQVVKDLLYKQVRRHIEDHLRRVESARELAGAALNLDEAELKVAEAEPCPACGASVPVGQTHCSSCGCNVEQARREAARTGAVAPKPPSSAQPSKPPASAADETPAAKTPQPAPQEKKPEAKHRTGEWQVRLASGQPSKPLPFTALLKLARERRLSPKTVLRGPLTRGVWRQARHTPRLCRLFGVCHFCEKRLPPKAARCPACGRHIDRPPED
jgi:serine/threonine protein kinase